MTVIPPSKTSFNTCRGRTERDADSDLARVQADCVRDRAVDADGGKKGCTRSECAESPRVSLSGPQRLLRPVCHRLFRIDRVPAATAQLGTRRIFGRIARPMQSDEGHPYTP